MICNAHHVHLFASDIDESIRYYSGCFGGEVVIDDIFAGARNIFMKIGSGRIHFYDQLPREQGRGAIHHLGIQTDDLISLVGVMKKRGVNFIKGISNFGFGINNHPVNFRLLGCARKNFKVHGDLRKKTLFEAGSLEQSGETSDRRKSMQKLGA